MAAERTLAETFMLAAVRDGQAFRKLEQVVYRAGRCRTRRGRPGGTATRVRPRPARTVVTPVARFIPGTPVRTRARDSRTHAHRMPFPAPRTRERLFPPGRSTMWLVSTRLHAPSVDGKAPTHPPTHPTVAWLKFLSLEVPVPWTI